MTRELYKSLNESRRQEKWISMVHSVWQFCQCKAIQQELEIQPVLLCVYRSLCERMCICDVCVNMYVPVMSVRIYVYLWWLCECLCTCTHSTGQIAWIPQSWGYRHLWDTWFLLWLLGSNPGPHDYTASTLLHWAISAESTTVVLTLKVCLVLFWKHLFVHCWHVQ